MARILPTLSGLNRWSAPEAPEGFEDAMNNPGQQIVVWEQNYNPTSFVGKDAAGKALTRALSRINHFFPAYMGFQVQRSLGTVETGVAMVVVTYHDSIG